MKTPVVLVAVALTVAILLTASLLIATQTRGDEGRAMMDCEPVARLERSRNPGSCFAGGPGLRDRAPIRATRSLHPGYATSSRKS